MYGTGQKQTKIQTNRQTDRPTDTMKQEDMFTAEISQNTSAALQETDHAQSERDRHKH